MKNALCDSGQAEINIIVSRNGNKLKICEGVPTDNEMARAGPYVQFIYAHHLVKVWLNGQLRPAELHLISHNVLDYIKLDNQGQIDPV